MASLADIRARLAAQENKSTGNNYPQSDGAIYPHWKMDEGALASMRFLPDADSSNSFFWIERQVIKLPFNGVKGDINSKQVTVQVPCVEMFGENCPVLAEVRPWYKDETLKEMANKYWKKRSYLFKVLYVKTLSVKMKHLRIQFVDLLFHLKSLLLSKPL